MVFNRFSPLCCAPHCAAPGAADILQMSLAFFGMVLLTTTYAVIYLIESK
jgi:hypothetical protein